MIMKSCYTFEASCSSNDPVCGIDGKTYKNICELNKAKLRDQDLAVLYDGHCLTEKMLLSHKRESSKKLNKNNNSKQKIENTVNKPEDIYGDKISIYSENRVIVFKYGQCGRKCHSQCSNRIIMPEKVIYFTRNCLECCIKHGNRKIIQIL